MSQMATVLLNFWSGTPQFWRIQNNQLITTWIEPNGAWAPLQLFVPQPQFVPGGIQGVLLGDYIGQLFATDGDQIWTIWKASSAPDAAWVSANGNAWEKIWQPMDGLTSQMAAVLVDDNTPQFWVIANDQLYTSWKEPNGSWAPLQLFVPQPQFVPDGIQAVLLGDLRGQLFATSGDQIWTIWKANSAPDAAWVSANGNAWERIWQPTDGLASQMAAVLLNAGGNGTPQFWVIANSQLYTSWKEPNGTWAPLQPFVPLPQFVPDGVQAGLLGNRTGQLFATSGDQIWNIWKASSVPDAPWVSQDGNTWEPFTP